MKLINCYGLIKGAHEWSTCKGIPFIEKTKLRRKGGARGSSLLKYLGFACGPSQLGLAP